MKMKIKYIGVLLLLSALLPVLAQEKGVGGGVYLEDGATLSNCLVRDNRASDGYGVAGGNAVVVNTTVVENGVALLEVKDVRLGDVYCRDGAFLTTADYAAAGRTDAIGVVFWVDPAQIGKEQKILVMALQESKKKWFNNSSANAVDVLTTVETILRDTACYRHQTKMLAHTYSAQFFAGQYCYSFGEKAGHPARIRWCLGTVCQYSRMAFYRGKLNQTLDFLKKQHPGQAIDLLSEEDYWTSTECGKREMEKVKFAYTVNFLKTDYEGSIEKVKECCVRPICVMY